MEASSFLYAFFAARYFAPMTIFMTPFLIEKKKFTNKEIFNKITPFFFIASLFASFLGPVLVSYIGNQKTLWLETGVELITYAIFFYMPERSFFLATLTGLLHGVVTSLGSLTKGILVEHKGNNSQEDMFRNHAAIKKTCGVLSSWIGQDMKYATQTHQTSLIFSFITLTSSFGLCALIPDTGVRNTKKNFLKIMFGPNGYSEMREIYTNNILYFSILNIIGSTLYICFALYSANIFISRKKDVDPSVLRAGKILYLISKPVRMFSWIIVSLVGLFDSSISYNPSYDKNTVIFGYIDGIAKLFAMISSVSLSFVTQNKLNLTLMCFLSTILVIFFTFLMGKAESLFKSYVIFILGSVASQISMLWTYKELSVQKENIHIILGMNLFVSSILHTSVSYYCKWKNSDVNAKVLMYFYVSSSLLFIAAAIKVGGLM